ncbi:unnamed protein product [Peniophora sp. CBMAI 1063]|nr:unnamed protein product [Peniophora sp. CBMAI 1063]
MPRGCLVSSATAAACGISVDSALLIQYFKANVRTIKTRARDRYFDNLSSALFSRLPLFFVSTSGFSLALLLLIAAHASPGWVGRCGGVMLGQLRVLASL